MRYRRFLARQSCCGSQQFGTPRLMSRMMSQRSILASWTALEVLTPQPYREPEERFIASLENATLPWHGQGEKSDPNYHLFYEIVLGTIELEKAVTALLEVYADSRVERPSVKSKSLLATAIVDRTGKLVEGSAVSVSSFAWGAPKALRGDLRVLSEWPTAETQLVSTLEAMLRKTDERGDELPLDGDMLQAAYAQFVKLLCLPSEWVKPPTFAIRRYEYIKNTETPEPSLLSSFFLKDLTTVENLFRNGNATRNLRLYLGADKPIRRIDLLNDTNALNAAVAPEMIPPARWPSPGGHSLVLLQQAAVDLAFSELKDTGILAVNGPPGTGKTTLLRDILAGIVTQRAEAMCAFNNPADAFEKTPHKLSVGQAWLQFYQLSNTLKGYEILIASSNNKAVENVSTELPGLQAIDEDADLRYFAPLATSLLERESWGLIAAVLGNANNRYKFRQKFWWDADFGLSTYLAEATGTPQRITVRDPKTSEILEERPPRIVLECDAPKNQAEALNRWHQAKKNFQSALAESQTALEQLTTIKKQLAQLSCLEQREQSALSERENIRAQQCTLQAQLDEVKTIYALSEDEFRAVQKSESQHFALKPNLFMRAVQPAAYSAWKKQWTLFLQMTQSLKSKHENYLTQFSTLNSQLHDTAIALKDKDARYASASQAYAQARGSVEQAKLDLAPHLIHDDFFARAHADKHLTTPWCNKTTQHLRNKVFAQAIALHKAFIDAAARPLRHNLGLLMQVFSGRSFPDAKKQALLGDLWSSFFLVVPSVSTTFASVERMLGKLPPDALGWLLVDEAGQALPQAAVGAVMRTRRAVFVGDPMQIEPVVILPDALTQSICRHFGVDPEDYNAPQASAQTIADAATSYYGEFDGKYGSRSVGVPLLVHRRCADPMFGVSNAMAYEHLMVQAKRFGPSKIRDCLGPSVWIDVQGYAQGKWSPEEGQVVVEMLTKLRQAKPDLDLFIVTPFVDVQNNMRRAILESGVLREWIAKPHEWTSARVGTVHTVQGREAEAVIFVLGACSPGQAGARNWAGAYPNLLNVAVTRAKEALYVVGNRQLWQRAGRFGELAERVRVSGALNSQLLYESSTAIPMLLPQRRMAMLPQVLQNASVL
jgi:hypothetical protein